MNSHRYCYHITDGVTRSALRCGTVTAHSMEEAAEIAARSAKLEKRNAARSDDEPPDWRWFTAEGKRRSVYVLHDPKP